MAARYLIGTGNRNWNDTANWSATSGGVGGASVPTSDDDVYFDSNSGTGTVTVNTTANMRDCTFAQTQLITLANAAYAFNIYGNWTLCSKTYLNTSFTGTGYVHLKATTSVNITSNGCTRAWNRLYFYGIGGTWTNQDDFSIGYTQIFHYAGTWDTNNCTITALISIVSDNVGVNRTLSFRNSTINVFDNFTIASSSNLTLNAGTSTINCIGHFMGASKSYYNVILNSSASTGISGVNTFNNLSIIRGSLNGVALTLADNQIINNELKIIGSNSSNFRAIFASNTIGTPRTITCNGTITTSNVDFRDIVGAGAANWDLSAIEGGSGDCGGNSGITFTPAQTQYFKHTLGAVNWSDVTKWFSNYERTIAGRVPLPQDDAIFDENSFTGASTLTVNVPRIGGLNMEGVDRSVIFYLLNVIGCHGNFLFNENISYAFSAKALHFFSIYDCYLSTHNAKMWDVVFYNRSKITLLSNFQPNVFYLYEPLNGIFDLNGFTVSCYWFQPIYSGSYTTILGTGCIETKTYGSSAAFKPTTNFFAQESTIIFNSPNTAISIQIYLSGKSFNIIIVAGENINPYVIKDNGSINELIINSGRKVHFTNGTTQTIGKLTAIGTPEQPITIGSTTAGQRHTINYMGSEASTVEYCNISDSKVTQARRLLAKNSVNVGNNQNWGFEELPPLALNFGQVDKMYVGGSEVVSAYYGEVKIK